MSKTRILQFSTPNGEEEYVIFLDEQTTPGFVLPAEEYCRSGFTLDSDDTVETEMPNGFPLSKYLIRTLMNEC
jgi:hypothetical protein